MTLLRRVEKYLRRNGMAASTFGRAAVGDPGFVRDLRRGRQVRASTEGRVEAWLAQAERMELGRCRG